MPAQGRHTLRTVAVAEPSPVSLSRQFLAMSKKHHLAVVLLVSLASYQVARAQEPLQLPSPELAIPGVAQKFAPNAPAVDISSAVKKRDLALSGW